MDHTGAAASVVQLGQLQPGAAYRFRVRAMAADGKAGPTFGEKKTRDML